MVFEKFKKAVDKGLPNSADSRYQGNMKLHILPPCTLCSTSCILRRMRNPLRREASVAWWISIILTSTHISYLLSHLFSLPSPKYSVQLTRLHRGGQTPQPRGKRQRRTRQLLRQDALSRIPRHEPLPHGSDARIRERRRRNLGKLRHHAFPMREHRGWRGLVPRRSGIEGKGKRLCRVRVSSIIWILFFCKICA